MASRTPPKKTAAKPPAEEASRKPFAEEVEAFALRSIKRHTTERNFEAVAEVFAWIGKFHEMQEVEQHSTQKKEKADVQS